MPLGPVVAALFLLSCVTGKFVPDSEWFQAYLLLLGLDWICVLQNTVFLKNNFVILEKHRAAFQHGSGVSHTRPKGSNPKWFSVHVSHWALWGAAGFQLLFMVLTKKETHYSTNELNAIHSSARKCSFLVLKIIQSNAPVPNIFSSKYIHILIIQITSQPVHRTTITVFCWQISKIVSHLVDEQPGLKLVLSGNAEGCSLLNSASGEMKRNCLKIAIPNCSEFPLQCCTTTLCAINCQRSL